MVTSFFKDCVGAFIAFSIDDLASFEGVGRWLSLIKENCVNEIDVLLLGTKADLFESRTVPIEQAKELAKKHDCFYLETSAKTNNLDKGRIQEAFEVLVALSHVKMRGGDHANRREMLSIKTEVRRDKNVSGLNDNVSERSPQNKSGCC